MARPSGRVVLAAAAIAAAACLGVVHHELATRPGWAAALVNTAHAVGVTPYRAVAFRRQVATPYPAETVTDPALPSGLHEVRTPGRSGLLLETGILLYRAPAVRAAAAAGGRVRFAGPPAPRAAPAPVAPPAEVRVFGEVPLRAPVAAVVAVGTATDLVQVSGRSYRFSSVLDMVATAYNAGSGSNGSFTGEPSAIGLPLQYGVVAVDPHVIPLGSRLYVQGYGLAVAADTGSAIVGDRIDLFFWNSPAAIAAFGIRRLKVYILDDPRLPPVPVPDAVLREFGSAKPVQPASGSGASASGPSSSGAPGASAKAA